ncbi:MAG: GGDEF domain-containing protein, partial [Boseongicola sp.]|nr:GGDEF domain-containing protein [Boseongicola sp.]
MPREQSQVSSRFHALATRRGFWIAVALLAAITSAAALEFRRYAASILDFQTEIQAHQTTGSQAALNEIARLNGEILSTMSADHQDALDLVAVTSALDTLYVRADHIAKRIDRLEEGSALAGFDSPDDIMQDGLNTVARIRTLVSTVDEALVAPDPVVALQAVEIVQAIEAARRASFRYLDHTARMTGGLLSQQTDKVLYLNRATLAFLVIVALAGVISLHMLRLEVQGRKERERAERRADRLAYFDSLTGLANRVQFQDKVGAFLEPNAKGALVLIDLDGFKAINDRHGHAIGDAVLRQIARIIREKAEFAGGMAARLGGDEFAVFMPTDDTQVLRVFCHKLVELCAVPMQLASTSIQTGVSIGLATTTQVSKTALKSYDRMMRVADFALYASKGAGRGRYTLYDADLERQMDERRSLLKELPKAIENDELEVFL